MNVAVVGLGLIGGSFEKASRRAGYSVATLHHGDETGFENADLVLVCLPPEAIVPWLKKHGPQFKKGAIAVDIAGIKREIMDDFAAAFPVPPTDWTFVGGHPMAGREVSGYANSLETLFDGASMILVEDERQRTGMTKEADELLGARHNGGEAFLPRRNKEAVSLSRRDKSVASPMLRDCLESYFRSLGFAKIVWTSAAHHDAMIAFTSQLCHIIATSYARDELVPETPGFSAGSYANMTRIATQNADIWSALYASNRDALVPVLDRFISRLSDFRAALAADNVAAMKQMIDEGTAAKKHELASK